MTTQIKLASIESTALNTLQGPRITSVQVDVDSGYTSSTANAVGLSGGYISINGSGFVTGCTVIIGSATATSVSFVSSVKVNCQVPAQSAGTYTVYLINPDGSTAIRVNAVQYSSTPSWVTSGTQTSTNPISLQLSATSDTTVTYSLQAGSSLPSGMTLTSGGLLSGSVSGTNSTTYNFTIVATDLELQYTPQAFAVTINFADPYFYLTTLAVNADSAGSATVITDASTNNFELTVTGTPRANNNTPFSTGWSNYFNGSTDYITTTASSSAFTFGTGDWTVEMWINTITFGNRGLFQTSTTSGGMTASSGGGGIQIYLTTSNTIGISVNSTWTNTATTAMVAGIWYHIALVKYSNNVKLYINGTADSGFGTVSDTTNYTATYACYGGYYSTSYLCNSYISNLRVVKGTAVYTGNFTPPTAVLSAIANTSYLVSQSNRFIDNSSNAVAQVINGTPTVQNFNPFNITNTGTDGSMYFGSANYLTIASNSVYAIGTSSFTFEAWVYSTSYTTYNYIYCNAATGGFVFYVTSSTLVVRTWNGTDLLSSSTIPALNTWAHVVAVRSGTTLSIFVNGVRTATGTFSTNFAQGAGTIGNDSANAAPWYGYISNLRLVVGTAVYDPTLTTLTIPSAALTAVANTQLLTIQNRYSHNTTTGHQDTSTNQSLITTTGTPTSGTFSPFSQTGWSTYFPGSSYLTVPYTTANFDWWTGDYTLEAWIYPTTFTGWANGYGHPIMVTNGSPTGDYNYWSFGINATGYVTFFYYNGTPINNVSTLLTNLNQWNHIAFTKSSSGVYVFCNGTRSSLITISGTPQSNTGYNLVIGSEYNGSITGYVSNLRIVKGTAVYSGSTYTVPTSSLTAITNTTLLTLQDNRFKDNSTNALAVTSAGGTPSIQAFSPFAPSSVYNATTNGGSVYLNGGDYMQINSPAFAFGTADFTIEMWVYQSSANSNNGIFQISGTSGGFQANQSTNIALAFNSSSGYTIYFKNTYGYGSVPTVGGWDHLAIVRSSGYTKLYINGIWQSSLNGTDTTNYTGTYLVIGGYYSTSYKMTGYISNFRIVNGTAVYSTNFTPPTAPVVSTAAAVLLTVNGSSTAITDVSSRNNLITASTAKVSTGRSKFGTGSLYFNGSSDYIDIPVNAIYNFGTGDFTVEGWYYFNSFAAYNNLTGLGTGAAGGGPYTGWLLRYDGPTSGNPNRLSWYRYDGTETDITFSITLSTGQWYHIAACRSSTNLRMFVNGTQAGTTVTNSLSYNAVNTDPVRIGRWNGGNAERYTGMYVDDLRITRGYARYTSNFTAPTLTFLTR